jgi:NAD(P)-dependent dehydrogenase (short-subunit alcohol dehydrogenase family)
VSAIDLNGRVVVVTGASRGIGKVLAIGLAEQGAKVVCAARSLTSPVEGIGGTVRDTAQAISDAGGTALAVQCDIGREADITGLVDATMDEFGRVDSLINNATTPTHASFAESTVADWDTSMRVNVRSIYLFAKAVVPQMTQQGGGSIVNMSSHGAMHESQPYMPAGYSIYSVAKAAIERFTTALAPELAPLGITMNALRPGAVKTEGTLLEYGADYDWTGWSEPAAVVPAISFLAAQIGTDFTGRVLDVAGFGRSWPE